MDAPFPCVFSNHFTRIRFNETVSPEFVAYYFNHLWDISYFKTIAVRHVGQSDVSRQFLQKIKFQLPPLAEQHKITEIISTVDKKLGLEHQEKAYLENIKKGFMNELLSGRIRTVIANAKI